MFQTFKIKKYIMTFYLHGADGGRPQIPFREILSNNPALRRYLLFVHQAQEH
jgi:hypothetical protein